MKGLAWIAAVICLLVGDRPTNGAPSEDIITSLPGLDFSINYAQYSGYLDGGEGRQLHYWFVESQNDPASDPVVLWLNGGPGCSSIGGLLTENGPVHVNDDGVTLYANPYSWNLIANVIYLESPAMVGYSYNTEDIASEDDDTTSLQNYLALQDFFTNKFPEYAANEFYITGESYGGVYIPTLSVRIVNGTYPINFKAFAIGNPYVNVEMNDRSTYFYYYYHGLTGVAEWNDYVSACCSGNATIDTCSHHDDAVKCDKAKIAIEDTIGSIDPYNILENEDDETLGRRKRGEKELPRMRPSFAKYQAAKKRDLKNLPPLLRRGVPTKAQLQDDYETWMNRQDVRDALHIPDSVGTWVDCGGPAYDQIYEDLKPQFDYLLPNVPSLIYNGDIDTVCNFIGDQWFVERLQRKVTKDWGAWYLDGQVGGWAKSYSNITFITVKGSGHMVPEDQPALAFELFSRFLNGESF